MHATLRRYEGVDQARSYELVEKVGDTLMPRLSELAGFAGYYLIEAGDGVMTSISLFETSSEADESTRLEGEWMREEELEAALPIPPKITSGPVIVHKQARLLSAV
jgi:hypothetical protein